MIFQKYFIILLEEIIRFCSPTTSLTCNGILLVGFRGISSSCRLSRVSACLHKWTTCTNSVCESKLACSLKQTVIGLLIKKCRLSSTPPSNATIPHPCNRKQRYSPAISCQRGITAYRNLLLVNEVFYIHGNSCGSITLFGTNMGTGSFLFFKKKNKHFKQEEKNLQNVK